MPITLPVTFFEAVQRPYPKFYVVASSNADVSIDGQIASTWLVAGCPRVAIVRDGKVNLLPRENLGSIYTRLYVSGGRLTADHKGTTRLIACFSATQWAEAFVPMAY